MKKIFLAILLVVALVICVSACNDVTEPEVNYTITFDADGGTTVDSQTIKAGEKATEPTAPTKEGHTFAGWYDGETAYDFATVVSANVTLKARWTVNTYVVSFDADNGSEVVTESVAHGATVTEPTAPTKAGHTFAGWYNGEVAYDFTAAVTGTVTLKAHWTVNTYVVSFDADNGSEVATESVAHGATVTEPTAPIKEGHTFAGWYNGEVAYDFTAAVTGTVTLKARWTVNTYVVSFDADNGSDVATESVAHGATVTQPTAPTKEGYTFAGWYNGEVAYDFDTVVTGPVSLTAKWVYDLDWAEVVGAWTATEQPMEGVTKVYTFIFFADQTAIGNINNDMMGYVYDEALVFTTVAITNGELVLTTSTDSYTFAYNNGTLVEKNKGFTASPKNIGSDVVGTWAGNEDYSGVMIPYTLTIGEDGSVEGSCDMFGYVYEFEVESLDNKLVVVAMGAMKATLVYDGENLVGTGIMGGALTMAPYVEEVEEITLETIAGTWTGIETAYGMDFTYDYVINADGTGSAKYSSNGYETALILDCFAVENNKLVLSYFNYEGDEEPLTITYSYTDGTLVGKGIMGETLTLTKKVVEEEEEDTLTVESLAGDWTGTEVTDYGNYVYNITINADGTVTGGYVDEEGQYPSDFADATITIDGETVTLAYVSYSTDYTIVFTYADGTLTSTQGAMWGTLTLTKKAVEEESGLTFETLAGTWTGTEVAYGMDFAYTVVINADGTGSAIYNSFGSDTTILVESLEIVEESLVIHYYNYEGDDETVSLTFAYTDGKLAGGGIMEGPLTLTKA